MTPTPLSFTQGNNPVNLNLVATDGNGNPVDITGASFTTQILGPLGAIVSIPNSQHTITNGPAGAYTVALTLAQSQACNIGPNKDILLTAVQGSQTTTYRGQGILTVYPPVPVA